MIARQPTEDKWEENEWHKVLLNNRLAFKMKLLWLDPTDIQGSSLSGDDSVVDFHMTKQSFWYREEWGLSK